MNIAEIIKNIYLNMVSFLPQDMNTLPLVFLISVGIILYGLIIWTFYKILAKRDILELNLSKYNNSENEILNKIFAILLYIIEFLIITPLLTATWFFVLAILLLFLAKEMSIQSTLIISASLIIAIRICAYYNEDLSNDLAKMFPFTLLGVAISNPNFFEFEETISKVFEIGELFQNIFSYLILIFIIEVILLFLKIFEKKKKNL